MDKDIEEAIDKIMSNIIWHDDYDSYGYACGKVASQWGGGGGA